MTRAAFLRLHVLGTSVGLLALAVPASAEDAQCLEFFEKKVRPVLVEHCFKCHSPEAKKNPKGGLRLDSRAAMLDGGDSGPALVPGSPEKSKLIEAMGYKNIDLRMPPKGKLPDTVVADLTRWVQMGAPWPKEAGPGVGVKQDFDLAKRKKEHWAWQPVQPKKPPVVKDERWPRSDIDRFILAKLEEKGLTPAEPADRRTLIRRVTFDLIGLPPTAEDIDAALSDKSQEWFEKVVDRLLASDQFGERWARHWLDLVRYGESRGHEFDPIIPNAWQYRDYVIRALNADVPYNQFVQEHIAGDLLEKPRTHPKERFNESILGTGFWFLGEEVHSPVDIRADQADRFDNRIDVMGKTFLGLTVACARCHDHKFDAISTRDYYALFGFLESSGYRQVRFDSIEQNRRVASELWELRDKTRPVIQKALASQLRPGVERVADYLLAARQAATADAKLEDIAQKRNLDAGELRTRIEQFKRAASDERHPLHAWAKLAATKDEKQWAGVLRAFLEAGRKRLADSAGALKGAEVVIDYRKADAVWIPDDVCYGPRPARPGDLRLGTDPARPVAWLIEHASAQNDPVFNGTRAAAGSENEHGSLGKQFRGGRTIRTPRITLNAGKVYFLVRGSGMAYAAVGQHTVVAGPLHGQIIANFNTGDRFQWVGMDLTRYIGLRTHLEFSAPENGDLAVAMVVQCANQPPLIETPNQLVLRLLETDGKSADSLARGYEHLLLSTIERLGEDRIVEQADAADRAGLVNWMLGETSPMRGRVNVAEATRTFRDERKRLANQIRKESRLALAMYDGTGVDEFVFLRGSYKLPGPVVPRRFLEALVGADQRTPARGSGRLELAYQVTDPVTNPFVARVMVNRIWHHLFGRGIVASVDNFGVLGERPTHPELLDYLAGQFVKDGWSTKKLIRSLVLSNSYRMASQADPKAKQVDPQNLLMQHARLRRLEGEAIRDAILALSGRLDPKPFGPSVAVHLTAFQDGRGKPASGPIDGNGRRSLYLAVKRNFLSSFLLAFDTPTPFSTVGRRTMSNVPAQALILLNDPFVQQEARRWAERTLKEPGTARERIGRMYVSAFARQPTAAELMACEEFLAEQARLTGNTVGDVNAWADLAHTLFNVKEFIYLQ